MANLGTESFFSGLVEGVGGGLLEKEQRSYQEKLQAAKDRRSLLMSVINNPNSDFGMLATALEASAPPQQQPGMMSRLLHKGKKGQQQDPNAAIMKIAQVLRNKQMERDAWEAKQKAQAGAQPAPQTPPQPQGSTAAPPQVPPEAQIPASTPPVPTVGQASETPEATGTPQLPPFVTPTFPTGLHFAPPASPAEAAEQRKARMGTTEFEAETRFATEEGIRREQLSYTQKRQQALDAGLKAGSPEYMDAVFGIKVTPTRPETMDQAAADVFQKYQSGQMTEAQFDKAVGDLKKMKDVATKPVSVAQQQMDDWLAKNPGKGPSDYVRWRASIGDAGSLNLSPQAVSMLSRQFVQTGQLPSLGWGKTGSALRTKVYNDAAKEGSSSDIAQNRAVYASLSHSLNQLQRQAAMLNAFESTAGKNLDLFLKTAGPIVDSGSPWINTPLRAVAVGALGSNDLVAYNTARQVATTEVARVLNNMGSAGVLSDSARKEVQELTKPNATLANIYAASRILNADMKNRHDAFEGEISNLRDNLHRIGSPSGMAAPPSGGTPATPAVRGPAPKTADEYLKSIGR